MNSFLASPYGVVEPGLAETFFLGLEGSLRVCCLFFFKGFLVGFFFLFFFAALTVAPLAEDS